jgi:hypothetical protein
MRPENTMLPAPSETPSASAIYSDTHDQMTENSLPVNMQVRFLIRGENDNQIMRKSSKHDQIATLRADGKEVRTQTSSRPRMIVSPSRLRWSSLSCSMSLSRFPSIISISVPRALRMSRRYSSPLSPAPASLRASRY